MASIIDRIRQKLKRKPVAVSEQSKPSSSYSEPVYSRTSHAPPKQDRSKPVTIPKKFGNVGRLEIPSLDISVPLYDTKTGTAQQIVDNVNSAVFLHWENQKAIADHCGQANFSNLARAVAGKTIMMIDDHGSVSKYVCVKTQIGHIKICNSGPNKIFDSEWNPVRMQNEGGICIYTCIDKSEHDVMDIRLTYWRPVAERI